MLKRSLVLLTIVILAVAALNVPVFAQGCAMCKTALEQSAEGRAIAKSFDYGILFLMGFPYAMLGFAGIAIYRAYRSRNRQPEIQSK